MTFLEFLVSIGVTLTQYQRVFWKVAADRINPCDLPGEEREVARNVFGEVERVPPEAFSVIALMKGADVGFTYIGALRLLYRALTAPLDDAAPGEQRPCLIVAPDLRLARQALRYALGAAESHGEIAALIVSRTTDSFTLQREDDRLVPIECLPASSGGRATRGRRYIEVLMDEACMFRDADSGQVNDVDVFNSVAARTRTGTVWMGSTPWTESGLLYEVHRDEWGHPTTALAALLTTLAVRGDDPVIRAMVERGEKRDRENAAREYFGVPFGGGAGAFFHGQAITQAVDHERPFVLPPLQGGRAAAGADFAFVGDSSAIVVVQLVAGVVHVSEVFELRPAKGQPLAPSAVVESFARIAKRYALSAVCADAHYAESIREHLQRWELGLMPVPGGLDGKVGMFERTRALLHEGRLRLPNHGKLLAQLQAVVARPTSGGKISITSPRTRAGHGDLVSALVAAIHAVSFAVKSKWEVTNQGSIADDLSMGGF